MSLFSFLVRLLELGEESDVSLLTGKKWGASRKQGFRYAPREDMLRWP
jgi:hypothetical protein